MAYLGKEYTCYKQENYEGFLKSIGVADEQIQVLVSATYTQKLEKNGDTYKYTSNTPEGVKEISFVSGVEYDEVMGRSKTAVKVKFVVDGNTMTQTVKSAKGTTTFNREYNGDELVMAITADGWNGVAKQYFKA